MSEPSLTYEKVTGGNIVKLAALRRAGRTNANLVIGGAGTGFPTLLGALSALVDEGFTFEQVLGISSGCLVAAPFAAGIPMATITRALISDKADGGIDEIALTEPARDPLSTKYKREGLHSLNPLGSWLTSTFFNGTTQSFGDPPIRSESGQQDPFSSTRLAVRLVLDPRPPSRRPLGNWITQMDVFASEVAQRARDRLFPPNPTDDPKATGTLKWMVPLNFPWDLPRILPSPDPDILNGSSIVSLSMASMAIPLIFGPQRWAPPRHQGIEGALRHCYDGAFGGFPRGPIFKQGDDTVSNLPTIVIAMLDRRSPREQARWDEQVHPDKTFVRLSNGGVRATSFRDCTGSFRSTMFETGRTAVRQSLGLDNGRGHIA